MTRSALVYVAGPFGFVNQVRAASALPCTETVAPVQWSKIKVLYRD